MKVAKKGWLLVVFTAVLLLAMTVPVLAATGAGVEPVLFDPWQSGDAEYECNQAGCTLSDYGFKIDDWGEAGSMDGQYAANGGNTIVIGNDDGYTFDWTSNYPVYCVIVKAANAANVFYYPAGAYGDTGMYGPTNPSNNQLYAISHATFCYGDDNGGGGASAVLSGSKWYDRDKDGVWDDDEPGLGCWKIELQVPETDELGEMVWTTMDSVCTDGSGGYEFTFEDLADGEYTYRIVEGAASGCWVQTFPTGPNYYDVVITVADGVESYAVNGSPADGSDLDFGNVCEVQATGGYTLGYWSNKNGMGTLDGTAWMSYLAGYNLVDKAGAPFDPAKYADFRTWLLKADATNMSHMLSVQFAAKLLNEAYKGADYSGYGVIYNGEWASIGQLQDDANGFLAANPVTVESGALRAQAEFYKNVFDGLNNNVQMLIPYDPCPVPDFGCCEE